MRDSKETSILDDMLEIKALTDRLKHDLQKEKRDADRREAHMAWDEENAEPEPDDPHGHEEARR